MSEKWRPSPSVLSARRLTARNILTKRARFRHVLGESNEPHSNEPAMDSIWSWREAVEQIPHLG